MSRAQSAKIKEPRATSRLPGRLGYAGCYALAGSSLGTSNAILLTHLPFSPFSLGLSPPCIHFSICVLTAAVCCLYSTRLPLPSFWFRLACPKYLSLRQPDFFICNNFGQKLTSAPPPTDSLTAPPPRSHRLRLPWEENPPIRRRAWRRSFCFPWRLRFCCCCSHVKVPRFSLSSQPSPDFSGTGPSSSVLPLVWIGWIKTAGAHPSRSLLINPFVTGLYKWAFTAGYFFPQIFILRIFKRAGNLNSATNTPLLTTRELSWDAVSYCSPYFPFARFMRMARPLVFL